MKPSTKDEIQGNVHELIGTVKEKAGKVIGNPDLENKGQAEKLGGKVQKKVSQIEKVIGK
ncbi:MAG: CsbD family protein [Bryobacteraceae bacterium]